MASLFKEVSTFNCSLLIYFLPFYHIPSACVFFASETVLLFKFLGQLKRWMQRLNMHKERARKLFFPYLINCLPKIIFRLPWNYLGTWRKEYLEDRWLKQGNSCSSLFSTNDVILTLGLGRMATYLHPILKNCILQWRPELNQGSDVSGENLVFGKSWVWANLC